MRYRKQGSKKPGVLGFWACTARVESKGTCDGCWQQLMQLVKNKEPVENSHRLFHIGLGCIAYLRISGKYNFFSTGAKMAVTVWSALRVTVAVRAAPEALPLQWSKT